MARENGQFWAGQTQSSQGSPPPHGVRRTTKAVAWLCSLVLMLAFASWSSTVQAVTRPAVCDSPPPGSFNVNNFWIGGVHYAVTPIATLPTTEQGWRDSNQSGPLQQLINHVCSGPQSTRRTILFPPGNYVISEHVELDMTVICQLLPWSLPAVPRTTQAT